MAVELIGSRRPDSDYVRELSNGAYRREVKRVFTVRSDDPTDGPEVAAFASGIPRIGEPWEYDSSLFVSRVETSEYQNDSLTFLVSVYYIQSIPYTGDPDEIIVDPTQRPSIISWAYNRERVQIGETVDDPPKPIVNLAGEMFDPPVERDKARLVMSVQKNLASFSPELWASYIDTINESEWRGFAANTMLLSGMTAQTVYEGDFFYWQVSAEFSHNNDGWQPKLLEQGFRHYEDIEGVKTLVTAHDDSEDRLPLNQPVLLNWDGYREPDPNLALQTEFNIYKTTDFNGLPIP
jgi:hypothetical protein